METLPARINIDADENKEKRQLQTKRAKAFDNSVQLHYIRGPLQKKKQQKKQLVLQHRSHDNMTNSPI